MSESRTTRVACVDFGGTGIRGAVIEKDEHWVTADGAPVTHLLSVPLVFDTSCPNDATLDWLHLRQMLDRLLSYHGFDAISVSLAARQDKQGVITTAGNLTDWARRKWNLRQMLEERYGVSVLVDNDGAALAALEIVFGALSSPRLHGKSGYVVSPGTGVAVCGFFFLGGQYHILPGEGAHVVTNGNADALNPSCGCGRHCVESRASGRVLKRQAKLLYGKDAEPKQLTDHEVYAIMAAPLAELITNLVRTLPNHLEVVIMGGGVIQHRPGLVEQVERQTRQMLGGSFDTPEFIFSPNTEGGVHGAWANWWLRQQQLNGASSMATV